VAAFELPRAWGFASFCAVPWNPGRQAGQGAPSCPGRRVPPAGPLPGPRDDRGRTPVPDGHLQDMQLPDPHCFVCRIACGNPLDGLPDMHGCCVSHVKVVPASVSASHALNYVCWTFCPKTGPTSTPALLCWPLDGVLLTRGLSLCRTLVCLQAGASEEFWAVSRELVGAREHALLEPQPFSVALQKHLCNAFSHGPACRKRPYHCSSLDGLSGIVDSLHTNCLN